MGLQETVAAGLQTSEFHLVMIFEVYREAFGWLRIGDLADLEGINSYQSRKVEMAYCISRFQRDSTKPVVGITEYVRVWFEAFPKVL